MYSISHDEFADVVEGAVSRIKEPYKSRLVNVAFLVEPEPSPEQRVKLKLHCNQTLFGLYEGVPLPARGGSLKLLPDKITIFQKPIEFVSTDLKSLKDQVGRTVWHEVAHYFGLNHDRIHTLERREKPN